MLAASSGRRGGASSAGGVGLDGLRRSDGAGGTSSVAAPARAPPSVTERFTSAWQLHGNETCYVAKKITTLFSSLLFNFRCIESRREALFARLIKQPQGSE